jgi:DNA (cytosine-5)-methyltransferase 1
MSSRGRVAGLFAGIGGIELGLQDSGFDAVGLCEIDEAGRAVLRTGFHLGRGRLWRDVTQLSTLPRVDLLTAGFPCQDLSLAGRKDGIAGSRSGLVEHVFRLLDTREVPHVLLENVSYMRSLDGGRAMDVLVREFESRGYRWAYRVVDARSFGTPQRRQRVLFLASQSDLDPSEVLHSDDAGDVPFGDEVGDVDESALYGFYWTEGLRGLGWTKNAVPTIKGGSRLGIPSAPAIWNPQTGSFGTPTIRDGEALQGFPRDWTEPAEHAGFRPGYRWHLVGNAVCVSMSRWIGDRLADPRTVTSRVVPLRAGRWPLAARGGPGLNREKVEVSVRTSAEPYSLRDCLADELKPLSTRATRGFLKRATSSRLRFADGFLDDLRLHLKAMEDQQSTVT